jgi:tRNA A-37 threonylcarbamoyl transferase component Bud32
VACLTEDEALGYVTAPSRDARDAEVQRHLDECHACRVLVGEAARLAGGGGAPSPLKPQRLPLDLPLTLTVGEMIMGRFRIVRFVARGGMGEVYEAHDSVLNETVALKTLAITSLDDASAMDRLMAEVRLARQVTNPNVCRILEFGFHRPERAATAAEAVPFLTMEYLRGETLAARIDREGKLDPKYVEQLLLQIVSGLSAIHAAGIVHRDIKPHNIVLLPGPPERLVLTDFGLARALDAAGGRLTGPVVVGTLDYMAPEQLEGGARLTTRVDVYALGVVIFEMLTGTRPFGGATSLKSAIVRMRGPVPKPSSIVPGLDPIWDARVKRCLARNPQVRYARVEDIVSRPSTIAPAPRSYKWMAIRWVGLLCAAVASGYFFATYEPLTWFGIGEPRSAAAHIHRPRPAERVFTSRGCSEDMVRVQDRFCIDRFEAAAIDDTHERVLSPFYPPSAPLAAQVFVDWKTRFADGKAGMQAMPLPVPPIWQLDDSWSPRAVSRGGVIPQGYVSKFTAEAACASAGKRLCTAEEWMLACRGEGNTPFPYGPEYRDGACNVVRPDHPGQLLHGDPTIDQLDPRLNQVNGSDGVMLRPTGATPACKSKWGDDAVYDMVGNLDEWVDSPESAFYGGFYSRDTKLGCESKNTRHPPSHFNYSTGFRCCDMVR